MSTYTHVQEAVITAHRRDSLIVAALAISVRLGFYFATGFMADDAFITFRYAENIAHGLGFVYNAGEHVLGTSTPLFTLLLAFLNLFNVPIPAAALGVSLLGSAGTAVVLYRLAGLLRFRQLAFLPVLCYILWPRSLPADISGMETALFTFFVTATLYCYQRRLDFYTIGNATLAALTRPEGAILLLLAYIAVVYRSREQWWLHIVNSAVLILPWVLFASWYFGSPIPHTVSAKLALYSRFGTMSLWDNLVYLFGLNNPVGVVMIPAAVIGGYWLWRRMNYGRLAIAWMLVFFGFYLFSSTRLFFWYVAPIYPIYLLFATASVNWLWERLPIKQQLSRNNVLVVGVAATVVLLIGLKGPVNYYRDYQVTLESVHMAIGDYLYRQVEATEIVAAEDIGYMGYYSHRPILDRDGLVSPVAVPYNREGQYLQLVLDTKPAWVVASAESPISPFVADSTFLAHYSRVVHFEAKFAAYDVYRRKQ